MYVYMTSAVRRNKTKQILLGTSPRAYTHVIQIYSNNCFELNTHHLYTFKLISLVYLCQQAMRLNTNSTPKDLLTNDILLSIFDKISIVHRKRLSRVCKRWKELIDVTFLWVTVFSAVDDRRCVTDWEPSNWLSMKFVTKKDYIRIPKVSASEILSKTAEQLPNLTAIDLECCDMNNRIIRTILNNCKKVERINLDSSTRLNYYSFNLMVQDWSRLKHVNLSCCTEVNEVSALFLIQSLTRLESLNLCGTRINGHCLDELNTGMKRLDISYCWGVQDEGLSALARSRCIGLEELSVNSFDFDGAERCMIALNNNFLNLKHLQMSVGPCVAHDYFIDRVSSRGFESIAKMQQLETLIIEKICILDNSALLNIFKSCTKLRYLRLNLGWSNFCNDSSFANIDALLPNLEELHISNPSTLTSAGISGLGNLSKLKSLSLNNTNIDNDIFKSIEKLDKLNTISLDDCRSITLRGLNHLCRIATKYPERKFKVSLLGTGITVTRLKGRKNFPQNLFAQVSHFRATKYHFALPPPVIDLLR